MVVTKKMNEVSRIQVGKSLIKDVQAFYPEIQSLSPTKVVDWALRKALADRKAVDCAAPTQETTP
jgi:hypothetical protein